jgi:acyl-CoA thioesterase FadM
VRQSDGTRAAEGSSAQVWLDAEGRPAPLPERVRRALLGSLEDGATGGGGDRPGAVAR